MKILEKIIHFIEHILEKFHKTKFGIPNKPKNEQDVMLTKLDHFYIMGADIIYGNDDLKGPRNVKRMVVYGGAGKKSRYEVDFFVMLFNFNGSTYLFSKTDSLIDDSCFSKLPQGYIFNINRSDKEISIAAQDIMKACNDKKNIKYRNRYITVINGVDYGKMYYNDLRKGFDTGDIEYDDYTEFKFDSKETDKGVLLPVNDNESWNPEHGISIEGEISNFSNILKSSRKGAVIYRMYFSGHKGEGAIYDYSLIVDCQGPTGIFNYMKLWFTDESGDRYSLMVYSSSREEHTIHFNSNEPNIKKIEYEFSL